MPFEIVKQQMQAGVHTSTTECVRTIFRQQGLRGFYRGYLILITREVESKGTCGKPVVDSVFVYPVSSIRVVQSSPLEMMLDSHAWKKTLAARDQVPVSELHAAKVILIPFELADIGGGCPCGILRWYVGWSHHNTH